MPAAFRPYLLLTLLCAVLYLPGIASIPPTDRDEARFMQATKQMIETGDYVHIRFQDEPRNKKPVGIYWLQAAAVKLTGGELNAPWSYRLPSVLFAWLAVLATCAAGRRFFGANEGLIAGAVLATSFMIIVEAHVAKTDATLLAAAVLTMTALGRVYVTQEKNLGAALLFWVGLGLGILIKGPIIVLVVGAAVAALCIADRDLRWTFRSQPLFGIPLTAIIVLPWLLAVSGHAESSFLNDAVREDIWPKLIGGQETHGALPGAHLLSAFATLWPWSLLAPFVLIAAWRERTTPAVRFCLAWLIAGWLVFELVPTKLPHYTLPLFPAFALLAATVLTSGSVRPFMKAKAAFVYRVPWALASIVASGGIVSAADRFGDGSLTGAYVAGAMAIAAGVIGVTAISMRAFATAMTIVAAIFGAAFAGLIVPHLRALAVTQQVADAIARHPDHGKVFFGGFHEPSAVFLLGTETRLTSTLAATHQLLTNPKAIAVVSTAELPTAQQALAEAGWSLVELDRIKGYEYTRGRWVELAVISGKAP